MAANGNFNADNELHIDIRWGHGETMLGYRMPLPSNIARALNPLPRDRELGGWAAMHALEQMEHRRQAVRHMGHAIAEALMEMVEQRDTVNGYTREELAEMSMRARYDARPGR